MSRTFDESVSDFQTFLKKNEYPENVAWIEPDNILLSGKRLLYVRLPVPKSNAERARRLFDLAITNRHGILFGTICSIGEMTDIFRPGPIRLRSASASSAGTQAYAYVKTDRAAVAVIRNRLYWLYLRMRLRGKQHVRAELFR